MTEQFGVLIYDSECGLCVRFKKAVDLIDLKKQVSFMSIHDPEVYLKYPQLDKEACDEQVHLIKDTGEIIVGADVIEYLIQKLPGVQKFAWLLDSDSAKKASKVFYKKISEMRMMQKRNCYTCGSNKSRQK